MCIRKSTWSVYTAYLFRAYSQKIVRLVDLLATPILFDAEQM